ncbi:lysophospholipid acyltransferase family protein [bacterium SCSIO 12696]|nr:lysophospholipid acyltransferase family protein [bacterium SCSIO 12696]
MKTKIALALFRFVGYWPLGVARGLGTLVGRIMWRKQTREARITQTNIELCFPALSADQQAELARASVIELGKTFFELPLVLQRNPQWVYRKIKKVHNQALLDEALASERGTLIVSPHLGNWEVIGFEVGRQCHMTTMYEPSRYPEMDAIVKESRSKLGADLVPTDKRGVMALVKTLRTGGTVGILPDQEPDLESGDFAPFFDTPALTMTLLNKLVQRTGARAIITFSLRVPGGFEMFYQEPEAEFYGDDEKQALAALNRSVEAAVSNAPAQYQWEYKRFKRRPDGLPPVY